MNLFLFICVHLRFLEGDKISKDNNWVKDSGYFNFFDIYYQIAFQKVLLCHARKIAWKGNLLLSNERLIPSAYVFLPQTILLLFK